MDLTARGREPEVGITAHDATISFRIRASAATEDEAAKLIEPTARLIYERFGTLIVGEGSTDVPEALFAELVRTGATLATAESCTGGLIAHMITTMPGVSPYYPGGVVSYGNEAKVEMLGVAAALIEEHGAVSAEVAAAMALGVRRAIQCRDRRFGHGRRGPHGRHAGEAGGSGLPGPVDTAGNTNAPARHRIGSTAGHHPAPRRQSRHQLGAVDVVARVVTGRSRLRCSAYPRPTCPRSLLPANDALSSTSWLHRGGARVLPATRSLRRKASGRACRYGRECATASSSFAPASVFKPGITASE